jgi:opacity protein-like surface antigen
MKKKTLLMALMATLVSLDAAAYTHTYVGGTVGLQDVIAYPNVYRAWQPGLFIGYGSDFEKDYYIAGEFMATFAATISNNYTNRNDSMRNSPIISLSLIPGMYLVNGAMMFLRLGIAETYFPPVSTWRPGGIAGIGLDVSFTSCWSVRTEYDYSVFRAIDAGTPRSDMFALSLKYTFDA